MLKGGKKYKPQSIRSYKEPRLIQPTARLAHQISRETRMHQEIHILVPLP